MIGEEGVAHEKKFTVVLELGDEKYTASGKNIKTAQQAAAAVALLKTKHQRPAGRQTRSAFSRKSNADKPGKIREKRETMRISLIQLFKFSITFQLASIQSLPPSN